MHYKLLWIKASAKCINVNVVVTGLTDTYTLKNKGASQCHRITFLSEWFHKELYHLKNRSVSQKVICGERRFFRL